MTVNKATSLTFGAKPERINRAHLMASRAPRSDPVPIPRSSNTTSSSFFKKGAIQMDREDEEYEQLKQLYSFRTWVMFHRIQVHRKQHEAKKLVTSNVALRMEAPGYTTTGPPPLIAFMPALLTAHANDDFEENDQQAYSDDELIFGDLED